MGDVWQCSQHVPVNRALIPNTADFFFLCRRLVLARFPHDGIHAGEGGWGICLPLCYPIVACPDLLGTRCMVIVALAAPLVPVSDDEKHVCGQVLLGWLICVMERVDDGLQARCR